MSLFCPLPTNNSSQLIPCKSKPLPWPLGCLVMRLLQHFQLPFFNSLCSDCNDLFSTSWMIWNIPTSGPLHYYALIDLFSLLSLLAVHYFLLLRVFQWMGVLDLFIHSPTEGHLSCNLFWGLILNKDSMNIWEEVFVWTYIFISLE